MADGGVATGAPEVLSNVAAIPSSGAVYFDVAQNGTLAFVESDPRATQFELAWVSPDGRVDPLPLPLREYRVPRVSPDGTKIAVGIGPGRGRASDIWICDPISGVMTRLSVDSKNSGDPAWTRDSRRVAYGTNLPELGGSAIAAKAADGSDALTILARFEQSNPRAVLSWTADAQQLFFQVDGGAGKSADLMTLTLADGSVHPYAAGPAVEFGGTLSPDGAWFAYSSDESGTIEVYVQSYPGRAGRWQISAGGVYPRWSADGSEITYLSGADMMAVPVVTKPTFSPGLPRKLFTLSFRAGEEANCNYDRAPDGRFLIVRSTSPASNAEHVDVVLNWFEDLQLLLPAGGGK